MPSYRYDHIHLVSPNPEEAASFYERMFGAKVVIKRKLGERVNIVLDLNGSKIMILERQAQPESVPSSSGVSSSIDHFAIETDDLEAAVEELKAKGAEFAMEIRSILPTYREARLMAPDNVPIELCERK